MSAHFRLKLLCWNFMSHWSSTRLPAPVAWTEISLCYSVWESNLQWSKGAWGPLRSAELPFLSRMKHQPHEESQRSTEEKLKNFWDQTLWTFFHKNLRVGMDKAWEGIPEREHQNKGCKNHVLMAHSSEGNEIYIQCPKPTTAGIPRDSLHQGQNKTQATEQI